MGGAYDQSSKWEGLGNRTWEELMPRAARGRGLCQEQQVGGAWEPHVGGAYAKNSKWEGLMPLA